MKNRKILSPPCQNGVAITYIATRKLTVHNSSGFKTFSRFGLQYIRQYLNTVATAHNLRLIQQLNINLFLTPNANPGPPSPRFLQ